MVQAINRALHDAMADDDRVLVFGEDVARHGGVFRVTEGLAETFGDSGVSTRRWPSPPSSGRHRHGRPGFVPVPEIQFDGFIYPAFDQIVSHLAKYRMRTHGAIDMPVTLRVPSFGGIGAADHHSDSTETYRVHTAGLKVVCRPPRPTPTGSCATPSPAATRSSTWSPSAATGARGDRRHRRRRPPIGRAAIRRSRATMSPSPPTAVWLAPREAADWPRRTHGWVEVIDLRSLIPSTSRPSPSRCEDRPVCRHA